MTEAQLNDLRVAYMGYLIAKESYHCARLLSSKVNSIALETINLSSEKQNECTSHREAAASKDPLPYLKALRAEYEKRSCKCCACWPAPYSQLYYQEEALMTCEADLYNCLSRLIFPNVFNHTTDHEVPRYKDLIELGIKDEVIKSCERIAEKYV